MWCDTAYQNIILQRGQIATTLPKIAQENGITERQARTILDRLKSTGKATVKTTSKFSIITLIDYDCALENDSQLDSHLTGERQTARQSNVRPTLYKSDVQISREQSTRANDFNEVKQLFNSICVSLPPLEYDPTAQQARLVEQARINLRDSSFEEFFKRVEKSDFLCGRCGKWKATFEWILKPENMQKIRSGKYDQSYKQAATPTNALTANPWENMTDEEAAELAAHFYD